MPGSNLILLPQPSIVLDLPVYAMAPSCVMKYFYTSVSGASLCPEDRIV